ncbi:MAG: Parallel beta-helix repeat, partial [Geobacteraceae bacterium]
MHKNSFKILQLCLLILFIPAVPSLADTTVGGRISSDTVWTLSGSPYIVTSSVQVYGTTTTPVTLTIEPGVVVMFASNTGLYIGNGTNQGSLVARGTTTDRITFTRSGATGTWPGLTYYDGTVDATAAVENADIQYTTGISVTSASPVFRNCTVTDLSGYVSLSSANPTLENVAISNNGSYGIYLSSSSPTITGGSLTNTNTSGYGIYGGGSPVISNYSVSIVNSAGKYGLYLSSTTSALSVTNSTIGNGLYIGPTAITPTITGNTFTNLDNSPLHAGANIVGQILNSNTFNGLTAAGRIEVVSEQVKQDALWRKLAAPYWITSGTVAVYKDTVSPATLTIEAGSILKFASGTGLQIGNGTSQGALVARGTVPDRIVFTRSATSGTWGAITFNDGTVDATTAIEYADIQYSSGVTINSASPVFRNTTITDLTGYVSLSSANSLFENVTIANNGPYGFYLSSASPTITGGSLTNSNTTGYGIYGSGSPVISNYNVSIVNSAGKYGIYLSNPASALSITNSTIANGLYLGSTAITPTITGNTFTNLDNSPLHAGANIIAQLLAANTFTGMTAAGRIEVVGEQIKQDALWAKQIAPYWVVSGTVAVYKDTTTTATLTIEPGTIVKFASGAGLQIGNGTSQGALVARGT